MSKFGLLGQIISFLHLQYLQLFIFFSSLLYAFIISHLLWPLSHCKLLPSNLSPPVHSKHCGQGYLSCSPLWSCQVMSQSLRWFSVSLHYKVKFFLCNFKDLQESALAYNWTESLLFPWLRYSPAYCVYPYLMHDFLFLFPKLFSVPKIFSLLYCANQPHFPLSGLRTFCVNLVMSALGQESCWKYEAFVKLQV